MLLGHDHHNGVIQVEASIDSRCDRSNQKPLVSLHHHRMTRRSHLLLEGTIEILVDDEAKVGRGTGPSEKVEGRLLLVHEASCPEFRSLWK